MDFNFIVDLAQKAGAASGLIFGIMWWLERQDHNATQVKLDGWIKQITDSDKAAFERQIISLNNSTEVQRENGKVLTSLKEAISLLSELARQKWADRP